MFTQNHADLYQTNELVEKKQFDTQNVPILELSPNQFGII